MSKVTSRSDSTGTSLVGSMVDSSVIDSASFRGHHAGAAGVPSECPVLPFAFEARADLLSQLRARLADEKSRGLTGATVTFGMVRFACASPPWPARRLPPSVGS